MKDRLHRMVEEVATPSSAKNLYDAYLVSKRKEKRAADEGLVLLCTKLAMGIGVPRAVGPRLNIPGAAASVGRWNPLKGTVGRSPTPVGAKGVDTAAASVINPNRSIKQAIVAQTPMKATM